MMADPVLVAGLEQAFGKKISAPLQEFLRDRLAPDLLGADASRLTLAGGGSAQVVNHVPRFVPHDHYAGSFSFQWDAYQATQLDSAQNSNATAIELFDKASLNPELVKGKILLDAGVGTGRHSEVLAQWGAEVIGVDLSTSVDVAYGNLRRFENAVVLQANIGNLPFKPNSFDFISSIGVLHHTPDTKEYTSKLVPLLKDGGMLTIWLYSLRFARRKQWIPMTSTLPHAAFHDWCEWIIRWQRAQPENPFFRAVSTLMPFRSDHVTFERSVLALFDGYTPVYHGVHAPDEVVKWFEEFGLTDIRLGVTETSVSGRKPAR
jgi:SAM-dependent methyltransferase